jgi:hypothetical protein
MAAITGHTMAGIASRAVMIGRPRVARLRSSAIPSPSSSSSSPAREGTMSTTVVHTDWMKRWSRTSASV